MSLAFNNNNVAGLYFNNQEVNKCYWNGSLVYQKSGETVLIENGVAKIGVTKVVQEGGSGTSGTRGWSTITDEPGSILIYTEQYNPAGEHISIYPYIHLSYDLTNFDEIEVIADIRSEVSVDNYHYQGIYMEVYNSSYTKVAESTRQGGSGRTPFNPDGTVSIPYSAKITNTLDVSSLTGVHRIEIIAPCDMGNHGGNGFGWVHLRNFLIRQK